MSLRRSVAILAVILVSVHICGCGNRRSGAGKASSSDMAAAQALIDALDDNNLGPIQSQCYDGLQRRCVNWVPATSKALNTQFGRAKDLSMISTRVPANGWIEQIWSVRAERQNYQMRVSYLHTKIGHLEFRTASDKPWTHVMEIASGQNIK
ncbi:MAG: hypothetical protein ABFD83_11875 [Armatimonadota bacterium]